MLPISYAELIDVQQRASAKIDTLTHEITALERSLKNLTDQDLETLFTFGGSVDPIADREAFRIWQTTIKGYADNYSGSGELLDKSLIIQKYIKPTI